MVTAIGPLLPTVQLSWGKRPMQNLYEVLQRLLWSEMKDPEEFRASLERAGFIISPTEIQAEKTPNRYEPWLLSSSPRATGPWGIKDTQEGRNVLNDFLPMSTGAFCVLTRQEAELLIRQGRKRQWIAQSQNLEKL